MAVDRNGIPLAIRLTGGNVHDSQEFEDLLDELPKFSNPHGRPSWKPDEIHADKGYDSLKCRFACFRRRIKERIARRGKKLGEKFGRYRWVVERSFAWIHRFRRLTVRYERRADIHMAFLFLAASFICFSFALT